VQQRDQPAPEPTPATATDDGSKLTTTRKALYATITLGVGALDYVVVVFLLKYYTDYTGLDAVLAGVALLLGKAFDAVSDPIMGYISDHTKSRWGRRRPWFFSGAIPLSLSFIGMFSANPEWSQTQLFFWLVATNIFFWSGNTMVMVPHAAFASEMTETHGERISIMGWREGFMALGLLAGGTAMFFLLENAVDRATLEAIASGLTGDAVAEAARIARGEAHGTITMWLGIYVCALAAVSFVGTRERSTPQTPPRDTLFGDFLDTLRSRPFRLFTFALIIGQVADGLTASLALFAIEEWWGFEGSHPRYIMIGYIAMATLSIPVWIRIAKHFEKAHILAVSTLVGAISLIGMLFVPYLGLSWAYLAFYFSGAGLGGRMVMGMAIVPDIIDDDEVRTHTRKDGAYFGMISLLRKLSRSLAIGFSGIGLGFFGYVSGVSGQAQEALQGIRIMFCIVPAVSCVITAVILLWFPITRVRHQAALEELRARRAANIA
jgi:GPH family glycoside/pentoside/hexuronide:cation symporter